MYNIYIYVIYIYTYIHIYIYTYIHIYIYIVYYIYSNGRRLCRKLAMAMPRIRFANCRSASTLLCAVRSKILHTYVYVHIYIYT